MLSITKRIRLLPKEIDSAIVVFKQISDVLEDVQPNELTEKVGIFATTMPYWENLTEEQNSGIDFIRKICTGEITISKAKKIIKSIISELEETRKLINL